VRGRTVVLADGVRAFEAKAAGGVAGKVALKVNADRSWPSWFRAGPRRDNHRRASHGNQHPQSAGHPHLPGDELGLDLTSIIAVAVVWRHTVSRSLRVSPVERHQERRRNQGHWRLHSVLLRVRPLAGRRIASEGVADARLHRHVRCRGRARGALWRHHDCAAARRRRVCPVRVLVLITRPGDLSLQARQQERGRRCQCTSSSSWCGRPTRAGLTVTARRGDRLADRAPGPEARSVAWTSRSTSSRSTT
jgi:hypothetical protein